MPGRPACGPAPGAHISGPGTLERWFRTLKTECLRLAEYSTPAQLRRLIGEFVEQYNERRLHESLGYETPAEWYRSGIAEAA